MHNVSLKRRFIFNTLLILFAVMAVSAFLVERVYRGEALEGSYEKLRLHVFSLISVSSSDGQQLQLPYILSNPGFNRLGSGLWAAVLSNAGQVVWNSLSIDSVPELNIEQFQTGSWLATTINVNGTQYLAQVYKVAWDERDTQVPYYFVVAEDARVTGSLIQRFQRRIYGGFFLVTAALTVFQFLGLRSAFKPIAYLQQELKSLRDGNQNTLSMQYPVELQGSTQQINQLLENEYKQKERYRTTMADLAHSLKTPLSSIKMELNTMPDNLAVAQALAKIDSTIEYQLRRAVITGHQVVRPNTEVEAVLSDVVNALKKIYRDKCIDVNSVVQQDVRFRGDENDLIEVLGNVLDNAFKYARSKIAIDIRSTALGLTLKIEDDGVGLEREKADIIFARGKRLDQRGLGQGIGLAVVQDIVNQYDGAISTQSSELGGAAFLIHFTS